jgi:repressor LexA
VPVKVTVLASDRARRIAAGGAPALTRRQHQILDHLRRREAAGQHPPSLSDLCGELGVVSRGSMHKQIAALITAGLIEPMARKHRGVRLLALPEDGARRVPLLGVIAAGRPIEALAQSEALSLPESVVPTPGCYALAVRGDSMRDIGILDGDTVVIEPRTARATARSSSP